MKKIIILASALVGSTLSFAQTGQFPSQLNINMQPQLGISNSQGNLGGQNLNKMQADSNRQDYYRRNENSWGNRGMGDRPNYRNHEDRGEQGQGDRHRNRDREEGQGFDKNGGRGQNGSNQGFNPNGGHGQRGSNQGFDRESSQGQNQQNGGGFNQGSARPNGANQGNKDWKL